MDSLYLYSDARMNDGTLLRRGVNIGTTMHQKVNVFFFLDRSDAIPQPDDTVEDNP